MFPNANHLPAIPAQAPCHNTITPLVSRDFLLPKSGVLLGLCSVPWTSMPEAAVHKHTEPILAENEVRFARQIVAATPTGDLVPP